jgi:hypothetical protein
MVVVFPVPFIPTNITTKGSPEDFFSEARSRRLFLSSTARTDSMLSLKASLMDSDLFPNRERDVPMRRLWSSSDIFAATSTATSLLMS